MQLLLGNAAQRRHLSEFSRVVNNLFSFAGIGVTGKFEHFSTGAGLGPPAIAITGRTYHLVRNTEYTDHSIHWFLYDERQQEFKAQQFGVHATVVQAITDDLKAINPYVNYLHCFHQGSRRHRCTLELKDFSSNGDFAAVMHASNSTTINPRSILIRRRGHQQPQFINILSRHYEPLHYVILFPYADIGWGPQPLPGIPRLSQIQWYRSRLLANDDERFTIFGRLSAEYVVDMYSRTEEEWLSYIGRERKYHSNEVYEAAEHHDEEDELDPEIKLPASFVGSRAWTSAQTADAMALGRKYGKPTFFCTMTFNPDWPEVRERLLPGQSASDIPTIVARVFKSRLEKVLQVLRTCFGTKRYMIKVIEFQKRGFPHAHIIIKVLSILLFSIELKNDTFHYCQVDPEPPFEFLDTIISAELPRNNPVLREKVQKYMMHGQDHLSRPGSRCNRNGQCIYDFPQSVQPTTSVDEYGCLHLRRRQPEDIWVVPYCPALLQFADCHFHFDVVYTAKIFSYLYKYLYKGPDTTFFTVEDAVLTDGPHPVNEITDYEKGRYLSAPEACWRIFEFEITRKEPAVEGLPIHLPGHNIPQFRRSDGTRSSMSLLNRYFLRAPELQHLRYEEYFEQFVLYPYSDGDKILDRDHLEKPCQNVTRKKASRHVRVDKVARINSVSIRSGELFYLRTLLLHRSATSFEDLRKIG